MHLGGIEEPEEAIPELIDEELYVLQALCQHSAGAIRRTVHTDMCELYGAQFEIPTGSKERSKVGTILSRLESVGLAEQNMRTWYPNEKAQSVEVPV